MKKNIEKLILVTLLLGSSLAYAGQIKLITEVWAPYQMKENGKLTGISVDIVREIQSRIGNTEEIRVFPWNRGYNMALKKQGYALFTTTRTTIRENLFKWVGPIAQLEGRMFKLKSNKNVYKTEEDLKNAKSISVAKNGATHQVLIKNGYKNLDIRTSGSNQNNLKKLIKGKVELWPSGYYAGLYRLKLLGVEDDVVVTQAPSHMSGVLGIAFNISTDDKIIEKWQKALDKIKADGTYAKILKKYR